MKIKTETLDNLLKNLKKKNRPSQNRYGRS